MRVAFRLRTRVAGRCAGTLRLGNQQEICVGSRPCRQQSRCAGAAVVCGRDRRLFAADLARCTPVVATTWGHNVCRSGEIAAWPTRALPAISCRIRSVNAKFVASCFQCRIACRPERFRRTHYATKAIAQSTMQPGVRVMTGTDAPTNVRRVGTDTRDDDAARAGVAISGVPSGKWEQGELFRSA